MHILWLKTELLHPIDKGGKIRTYHTLKHLKERHHITYLCLDDGAASDDARRDAMEYCHDLVTVPFAAPARGSGAFFGDLARNLVSSLPYAVSRYRSAALRAALVRLVRERGVDLVICDFLAPSLNVPRDLTVPMVLFQHNVEAAIWARHASVASHPVKRAYMKEQWRRMRAFEREECRRYDRVIAVSDADRDAFVRDYGVADVVAVPTGVDIDFFRPRGGVAVNRNEMVFTGSMDWMPNEDGIAWFVDTVLPRVQREIPDAALTVVGRNPSALVRSLANRAPHVTVTGTVPDIRPFLERSAAVVVPLRVGGGTRLKIFEAMAMERPIVSSTIGAEGLPVRDGVDIVIADSPEAFADATIRLLQNSDEGNRIGQSAAEVVRQQFGWAAIAESFALACEEVVARRKSERVVSAA